jgi:hypothetical protein
MAGIGTDHEHHDRDGSDERQSYQAADRPGTCGRKGCWHSVLPEAVETQRETRVIGSELALYFVQNALLFH